MELRLCGGSNGGYSLSSNPDPEAPLGSGEPRIDSPLTVWGSRGGGEE